jgi:hypothetical protein
MTSKALEVQPLACVPGAIPENERASHFALARRLLRTGAPSRRPISNGHEWRLPANTLIDAARFVANERLCCPFLRFDLVLEPGAEELLLRMTGPEGAREVLDAELGLTGCGGNECGCAGR